jgi:hypothetical protein
MAGLLLLAMTVAGTYALSQRPRESIAAYRLKVIVPAFHVLTPEDVEITTVEQPKDGRGFASAVIGRYAMKALQTGKFVLLSDVGPDIPASTLKDASIIIGVPASSAEALAGRLSAGSLVRIESTKVPGRTYDARLLSVDKSNASAERPYVLVMALPATAGPILPELSAGDVVVTVPIN